MKKVKKILCVLLVAVMLVGVMPMGAFAAGFDLSTITTILQSDEFQKVANQVIADYQNGNLTTGNLGDYLLGMLKGGASDPEISAKLTELINSGVISNETLAKALEYMLNSGISADQISDILTGGSFDISKLIPILVDMNNNGVFDELLATLGVSGTTLDPELIAALAGLISGTGSGTSGIDTSALIAKLEALLGTSSTDTSFLDKFKDLLGGNGFSGFDISAIADALSKLMGNGSEADLPDEDTPLAASVSLNTVDHNAYINGYTDGSFRPNNGITRAEAAQMLYNLLTTDSHEKNDATTNSFSDVSASQWYNTAVSTLAGAGAISGYPDGTFRPNKTITRAEFVKMVVGLIGETAGAKSTFPDVAAGSWYYASVATAQTSGWVQGSGGAFRPNSSMTRAETVTFLNRVLGRTCDISYVTSHSVKSFTDVANGAWYFAAVMEAANGHDYTKTASGAESWTALR